MAIVAVSTPPGTGGIAVVRISGPDALQIANKVWRGKSIAEVSDHSARLGYFCSLEGTPIDQCVATVFKGPGSYTGYDTVEFSLHGSPWIQKEAVRQLVEAGAEPAGPGAFTRQAFLNGRIDLAQAESVADLMAASSKAAARVALTQLAGGVSEKLELLRQRLVNLASLLELELDFSEEDVEFANREQLRSDAEEILRETTRLADSYFRGKVVKEGLSVVLAGIPNAGKSSLLNYLVEEEKALVTEVEGTTRDIIEATTEINGILCRFYDTAGLRATEDLVEGLGIDRARHRIAESAVVLWLIDPTKPLEPQYEECHSTLGSDHPGHLIFVLTKSDLNSDNTDNSVNSKHNYSDIKESTSKEGLPHKSALINSHPTIRISVKTGEGIEDLRDMITENEEDVVENGETLLTNLRHYTELKAAIPYLTRLIEGLGTSTQITLPPDLLAEELRGALTHLSAITGTITTPDLLQTIFSHFCIGK